MIYRAHLVGWFDGMGGKHVDLRGGLNIYLYLLVYLSISIYLSIYIFTYLSIYLDPYISK